MSALLLERQSGLFDDGFRFVLDTHIGRIEGASNEEILKCGLYRATRYYLGRREDFNHLAARNLLISVGVPETLFTKAWGPMFVNAQKKGWIVKVPGGVKCPVRGNIGEGWCAIPVRREPDFS